jgi:hypothetical protein
MDSYLFIYLFIYLFKNYVTIFWGCLGGGRRRRHGHPEAQLIASFCSGIDQQ